MGITREIGAHYVQEKGTTFTFWAPDAEQAEVVLHVNSKQTIPLQREAFGYWVGLAEDAKPGTRYTFKLDNDKEFPDPASQSQPDGVHEASEVISHTYNWTDQNWKNLPLEEYIIYELHVGTFSEEGTFEGIINKLPELKDLGITAIELMPIAQFPGERNWGYDGVYPFAAQNSYGGPEGLKKLVDACHKAGIAVVLDVVYNHLGPEGNYTSSFGPYFTEKYNTPWGAALNFDDAHSDHVRNFFIQNALMWLRDFKIDALRLDAVHAILDTGAKHFLQELQEHVNHLEQQLHKPFYLIAESDLNDVRLINPIENGGYGLAAQWMDDYHHAIHTVTTGETDGYYSDFGKPEHLVKTLKHSFIYNGMYSEYRKRTIGTDATANPAKQFVVCSQNHDQVGNRMLGERLTKLVSFEMLKPIAALVILSPYTPMLFMGEEYGEENPFQFFVSHSDKDLVEAVRKGRKEEFASFAWQGEAPDPQSEETFNNSKLQHSYTESEKQNQLRKFYKELIQLRKSVLKKLCKEQLEATLNEEETVLQFTHTSAGLRCVINFSDQPQTITGTQGWQLVLNSADTKWGGPGSDNYTSGVITLQPESVLVLQAKA
ncbi:malto-oligosyltrehalose trehalohydrolase [Pontibacter sp. KCTC 32443]|uniref:malto-oligosyltrehalose trehalohydrolase n=1 Tax=Pontibacter TaxID=323449 RepID=UPI00164DFDDD|nr:MULTISPECIES: malto-oligosyltrehalose trehalohydrolase [Pontibacter]MBC5772655.1 malto-oligosyltrehalose trehalohydrolase [Pontibacter sp. KCTC 32443]